MTFGMDGSKLIQLSIVGLFPTSEYQKCKYYAEYLHSQLSHIFAVPKYRWMFDVQWTEFITKRKRICGTKLWKHTSPVVVFIDGVYLGDEEMFTKYCNENLGFHIYENFGIRGKKSLINFIKNNERPHVFMTISIDGEVIGTLLIQLFMDLVPLTCVNFLRLINRNRRGYRCAPVHRVAKSAWIQVGGYRLKRSNIICGCENYFVPHDARGILSMCHRGKHLDNSTQFFISLQNSRWMDYYYVAFGQVLHGEEVLQKIEAVPTKYEIPQVPIIVHDCGEYTCKEPVDPKYAENFKNWLKDEDKSEYENYPDDISDYRDVDSIYSEQKMLKGFYSIDDKDFPCMLPVEEEDDFYEEIPQYEEVEVKKIEYDTTFMV